MEFPMTFKNCPTKLIPSFEKLEKMECGRPRLELLNICSSSKKQKQVCNTRTITSEKQLFHKIINFYIGPLSVP